MTKRRQLRRTEESRNPAGKQEGETKSSTTDGLSWQHIWAIIQGSAVFVGISILLGRLYLLSYFDSLGIPVSEIRLNVTDYSVVSPVVTVFGVGFSLILVILMWSSGLGEIKGMSRLTRVLVGSGLWIAAILSPFFLDPTVQLDLNSVWLALLVLLIFALGSFGGAVIWSGILGDDQHGDQQNAQRKALMPLLLVMVVVLGIWIASEFSGIMGRLDAGVARATAPLARLTLTSHSEVALRYGPEQCGTDTQRCHFRVILVGDKYVYLQPAYHTEQERLLAVPTGDIASINYLFEGRAK